METLNADRLVSGKLVESFNHAENSYFDGVHFSEALWCIQTIAGPSLLWHVWALSQLCGNFFRKRPPQRLKINQQFSHLGKKTNTLYKQNSLLLSHGVCTKTFFFYQIQCNANVAWLKRQGYYFFPNECLFTLEPLEMVSYYIVFQQTKVPIKDKSNMKNYCTTVSSARSLERYITFF